MPSDNDFVETTAAGSAHKQVAQPAGGLAWLSLSEFRNHRDLKLAPGGRSIVLCGPNGVGKTNVLEAISFLAPGRGLRNARLIDVCRKGTGAPWAVAAGLVSKAGECRIGTGLDPRTAVDANESSGARRLVHINGEAASGSGILADVISLIWLTPSMDRLFNEGAAGRRRFFDRQVMNFDSTHSETAAAYERAMRERNIVLTQKPADRRWLDALEATMAEKGVALAAARRDAAARLRGALLEPDGDWPSMDLSLSGPLEEWLTQMPALEVEDRFRGRLRDLRTLDGAAGRATQGPHRSDLSVYNRDKEMPASECSSGEQKALLIAMVLAHARVQTAMRGTAPVLLLDEVAAHLDQSRRRQLFDQLAALGAQAWMTGTETSLFEDFRPLGHIAAWDGDEFRVAEKEE